MEAVASERRKLPPGGRLKEDYVFDGLGADGRPARIRFSELFAPGRDTLIVYHMMFPRYPTDTRPKPAEGALAGLPREETPCPSCTALVDQFEGAARHLEAAGFNFVVVAKTPLGAAAGVRAGEGLAASAVAVGGRQQLQARLPERGRGRRAGRAAAGVPPLAGRHPSLLELGAAVGRGGDRTGRARLRHGRAAVELHRPDARRPPDWNVGIDDHGPKEAKPALVAA